MGHLRCIGIRCGCDVQSRTDVANLQASRFMSRKFTDAQRHYRVFEQETIAILEALLKWEDKLIGYHILVVTDHQVLEFFKT